MSHGLNVNHTRNKPHLHYTLYRDKMTGENFSSPLVTCTHIKLFCSAASTVNVTAGSSSGVVDGLMTGEQYQFSVSGSGHVTLLILLVYYCHSTFSTVVTVVVVVVVTALCCMLILAWFHLSWNLMADLIIWFQIFFTCIVLSGVLYCRCNAASVVTHTDA